MRDLIRTIFKSTEDRLKNPFIGAFLTSALLFNWRPISYFIFSPDNIKDKIIYIDTNFNHSLFYLWLPLVAAIFYVGILPYVSLIFEYVVKFSINYRNDISLEAKAATLKLQIEVEKNAITLEEEKTTFRERKSHNVMVENLQDQIGFLNVKLEDANQSYQNLSNVNIQERDAYNQSLAKSSKEWSEKINSLNEIISEEKAKNFEKVKENAIDKNLLAKYEFTIQDLTDELHLEKFRFERFKYPVNKVVNIGNLVLLEYFISDSIIYWEVNNNELFDIKYIAALSTNNKIINRNNDRTTISHFESMFLSRYPDPNQMGGNADI